MKTVSAEDAHRHDAKRPPEIAVGDTASGGSPAATIQTAPRLTDREVAWDRMLTRLRSQTAVNLPRISRDDFYDD